MKWRIFAARATSLPSVETQYAGSVLCLAKTTEPDTSAFDAQEIVYRMKKHHHAGLIVQSPDPERIRTLLEEYSQQFLERFCASRAAARHTCSLRVARSDRRSFDSVLAEKPAKLRSR